MISDEKIAKLIIDTLNTVPILAGAESRNEACALWATLIRTAADWLAENSSPDAAMDVLAAVIGELAPRTDKMKQAIAKAQADQAIKTAQKGQFDA